MTDTPVKKALEDEQQGRQKKKYSKAKSSSRGQGTKAKKLGKREGAVKSKARKSLDYGSPPSSSEEEDDVCIVCLSHWSASKNGEEWIQCTQCKNWAHVECAGLDQKSPVYICHNCDSDAASIYHLLMSSTRKAAFLLCFISFSCAMQNMLLFLFHFVQLCDAKHAVVFYFCSWL